jgi:hypothetical protein
MNASRIALLVALPATLLLGACAPLTPNFAYQGFGAADPKRDREVVARIEATHAQAEEPSKKVVVLLDTIPEGIHFERGVTRVEPGFSHQILGKVAVSRNRHAAFVALLGFPNYVHTAHKVACYPQTILNFATLTMWGFISPTAYPCWGSSAFDEVEVVEALRAAGAAAGGDTVLATIVRYNGDVYGAGGVVIRAAPRTNGTKPAPRESTGVSASVLPDSFGQSNTSPISLAEPLDR